MTQRSWYSGKMIVMDLVMSKTAIRITGASPDTVVRCKDYPRCKWIGKVRDVISGGHKCPKCGGMLTNDFLPPK